VPVVGAAFAVGVAKHAFGGLGHNIWNPALAGRAFVQFAYPAQVTLSQWPMPRLLWGTPTDALTTASPLTVEGGKAGLSAVDLLFGNGVAGCLGETCKIALIAGGIYLIARNIVDWRVPVVYIGTVFLLSLVLPVPKDAATQLGDPIYQVLAGGLVIGAFFMATDMVSTPVTGAGRAIFAAGCGLIVVLIRRYGGYPEGVAYSILLMNTFTPLIDRWVRPRVYGTRVPKPATGEA
jgi:electron transport complex protein RnfD